LCLQWLYPHRARPNQREHAEFDEGEWNRRIDPLGWKGGWMNE
jgi:hypothetical protein